MTVTRAAKTKSLCWASVVALAYLLTSLVLAADIGWVNPSAEWWRKVRSGGEGYTAVQGLEADELIQASGEVWRKWRQGPLALTGGILLGGVAAALALVHLIRGRIRLAKPCTGVLIPRWSLGERVLHWTTAVLFLLLMLTGLSILYSRSLLIPLLGHGRVAAYLAWAKLIHNLFGPLFIVALAGMGLVWFRDNLWRRIDWEWFKSFGGMIGGCHPPAGKMNAGEKAWFWLLILFGGLASLTGLILDFPLFGLERETMQLSHLLHVASAMVVMAAALGHIYLGSIGTEGALAGMVHGEVDLSWARQHHDGWLSELKAPAIPPLKAQTEVVRPSSFFKP